MVKPGLAVKKMTGLILLLGLLGALFGLAMMGWGQTVQKPLPVAEKQQEMVAEPAEVPLPQQSNGPSQTGDSGIRIQELRDPFQPLWNPVPCETAGDTGVAAITPAGAAVPAEMGSGVTGFNLGKPATPDSNGNPIFAGELVAIYGETDTETEQNRAQISSRGDIFTVAQGDAIQGFRVVVIDAAAGQVVLEQNGQSLTLSLAEAYK